MILYELEGVLPYFLITFLFHIPVSAKNRSERKVWIPFNFFPPDELSFKCRVFSAFNSKAQNTGFIGTYQPIYFDAGSSQSVW